MGARTRPITVLQWMSDIRQMKLHGTRVIWSCQACGKWGPVDLDTIAIAMGLDEACTLWDCHPPCEIGDCTGLCLFHASPAPGTPSRPLISSTLAFEDLPAEASMAGWLGWHEFRPFERPGRHPPDPRHRASGP